MNISDSKAHLSVRTGARVLAPTVRIRRRTSRGSQAAAPADESWEDLHEAIRNEPRA